MQDRITISGNKYFQKTTEKFDFMVEHHVFAQQAAPTLQGVWICGFNLSLFCVCGGGVFIGISVS